MSPADLRRARRATAERWLPLAGIALVATGLLMFSAGLERLIPPCPWRALTGTWCPGCGSGRVARALLEGDLVRAWRSNGLVVLALPLTMYALAREALGEWNVVRLPWPKARPWTGWAILAIVLTYWILRNVPMWPLSLLAPR